MAKNRKKVSKVVVKKDGFTVEVHVYMIRGDQTRYEAKFNNAEPPITVDLLEENIDVLEHKIRDTVEKQLSLKWEDWILVQVSGSEFHPGAVKLILENALDVNYTRVQTSDIPGIGIVHRFPDRAAVNQFSNHIISGLPRLTKDYNDKTTRAMIKATPENQAALDAIMGQINHLRKRLNDLLSQKQIESTLKNVHAKLLLAPSGQIMGLITTEQSNGK